MIYTSAVRDNDYAHRQLAGFDRRRVLQERRRQSGDATQELQDRHDAWHAAVAVPDVWQPIADADADDCPAVCGRHDRIQEIRTLP